MDVIVFLSIVGVLFAADMWAHRGPQKPITLYNASAWSLVYIAGALAYAVYLALYSQPGWASLFLAGFVMEKALSVDNLMVFVAIFAYFKIPDEYRHRILHYGIAGAVVFRLIFVLLGAGALKAFGAPVGLVFALLVLYSAYAMLKGGSDGDEVDYANQWYARWVRRFLPFTNETHGGAFLARGRITGDLYGTPLLLCLIAIEISDVLFAFDSVPAVIAVTQEPVLVYSAMVFAILGLRQLYFVLNALLRYLRFLGTAVIGILFFIGAKLLFHSVNAFGFLPFHLPELSPNASLAVVLGALILGVVASLIWPEQSNEHGS